MLTTWHFPCLRWEFNLSREQSLSVPNAEEVCDLDDLALSLSALGIQTVPRAELARQSARVTLKQCRTAMSRAMLSKDELSNVEQRRASRGASKAGKPRREQSWHA